MLPGKSPLAFFTLIVKVFPLEEVLLYTENHVLQVQWCVWLNFIVGKLLFFTQLPIFSYEIVKATLYYNLWPL